tara:strand:- start:1074 stop:2006 length:933 start_codon:yes stop_codon:yes gene_type:complete
MKFKKPKFWDSEKPNFIALALLPFSYLIIFYNFLTRGKKKIDNIKTICIGNIYLGGTGKTPLCIEMMKILNTLDYKACFVKKNYSDQVDEQKLLASRGKIFCEKKRIDAIRKAVHEKFDVAIFDDGLQDNKIKYDLSIVCFNEKIGIGNGLVLPSGPLRENFKNLNLYDAVFLNGINYNESTFEKKIKENFPNLKIFRSTYSITNLNELEINEGYLAFAGIGNFGSFVDLLKINNFKILRSISYPDHYRYSENDIKKIKEIALSENLKIITTEKDYLRIQERMRKDIKLVQIKLDIKNKDEFIDFLRNRL